MFDNKQHVFKKFKLRRDFFLMKISAISIVKKLAKGLSPTHLKHLPKTAPKYYSLTFRKHTHIIS